MSRILTAIRSVLSTPVPTVAIEIAPDYVGAVAVGWAKTGMVVTDQAAEPLAPGVVLPSVSGSNVTDRAGVAGAVRAVLDRLQRRPTRVGLVVPDGAAKVSLLRFETEPGRASDLDELIRWQVRKAAPFHVEDAQMSTTRGIGLDDSGREFIVVMMRRDIVMEYEAVCVDAGVHPGLVDLASFNLINAELAESGSRFSDDWLLVHEASGYHTLAIVRGHHLIFFRNLAATGDDERALSDLVHQSAMYYEDRLDGTGITRTVLATRSTDDPEKRRRITDMLVRRLDVPVDDVVPGVGQDSGDGEPGVVHRAGSPARSAAAGAQWCGVGSMLRTNLSTRPFYNERAVHLVLLGVGLVAVFVMGTGALQVLRLGQEDRLLTAAADADEAAAVARDMQAVTVWRGTSETELRALVTSATQANQLIDRRVFSWTQFFNRIESTLPPSVMLESVRPDVEEGIMSVSLGVVGPDVEEIDAFVEELDASGAFSKILAREQEMTDDGTYRALLVGRYGAGPRPLPTATERTSR